MLNRKMLGLAASMVFALGVSTVHADEVPSGGVPMTSIIKNLQSSGYSLIKEVEYDDGVYKAKVVTQQGDFTKVIVDPANGKVLSEKTKSPGKKRLSMLQIATRVEKAGYTRIYEIEQGKRSYEVKALDKDGKQSKLRVDAVTGQIQTSWF